MGCTGIGKSSISAAIRDCVNGELVSADSVKVYRGLSIGSHKVYDPKHKVHMYDVVDLQQHYTVQDYANMAHTCVNDILSRGKTPIFFGGASMYMEWVLFGTGSVPPTDHVKMEAVEVRLRAMSCWDEAYHYAQQLDAAGVAHVLRNDYYRLARVVTIAEQLGDKAYSDRRGYETPKMDLDLRGAFVYPSDREALYRSLDRRCERMLADGLLEEVAGLMHQHRSVGLPRKITTIVGYRQTIDFLQQYPPGATITKEQFHAFLKSFQNATRSYARRQMVYFRRSEKLNRVFRCVPAGASNEALRGIGKGIVELFQLSPNEYEQDGRWRAPLPVGDASTLREYVSWAEVFHDPTNVIALLDRLSIERSRLKKLI